MKDAKPLTQDQFLLSLEHKVSDRVWGRSTADLADIITSHGLTEAVCGRHDGHAVKFGRAFELVFGERLK